MLPLDYDFYQEKIFLSELFVFEFLFVSCNADSQEIYFWHFLKDKLKICEAIKPSGFYFQ